MDYRNILNRIDSRRQERTKINNPQGIERKPMALEITTIRADSSSKSGKERTRTQNPQGIELKPLDLENTTKRFYSSMDDIDAYSALSEKEDVTDATRDNLYRSQIVMAVSAFDSFLHELSKTVTLLMYNNQWENNTKSYEDLVRSIKNSGETITKKTLIETMHKNIRRASFYNFSSKPGEGIEYCLFSLMGLDIKEVAKNSELWRGATPEHVFSDRIREIAKRRNTIAHEYDRDSSTFSSSYDRTSITKKYADGVVEDLGKIVDSILREVDRKKFRIPQSA